MEGFERCAFLLLVHAAPILGVTYMQLSTMGSRAPWLSVQMHKGERAADRRNSNSGASQGMARRIEEKESLPMHVSRATKLLTLTATAAIAVSLAPAGAETVPAPRYKAERTYVHCGVAPKAAVVDVVQGNLPTWDTTAPTSSVQQGAGCGTLDSPYSQFGGGASDRTDEAFDMVWEGTFTGNLDSIVVRAHAIWMGPGKVAEQAQAAARAGLGAYLSIDGETMPLPVAVSPKVIPSSTGASSEFVFTFDDLGLADPVTDADADGIADDEGTTERTIRLTLNPAGPDNPAMLWVWDTTEVPSGLHFNAPAEGPVLTPGE
jgi:hypothetical protein